MVEHEAEVDVERDRARHPLLDRLVGDVAQVENAAVVAGGGAGFGAREHQQLRGEVTRAQRRHVHPLDLRAHVRILDAPQQELEVHLQSGQRRAQLVCRVAEEALLHGVRLADLPQQVVERPDRRRDLDRHAALREGMQVGRTALEQLAADARERRHPVLDARPRQHGGGAGDEQGRHHLGGEDLVDQPLALVQRLADLHVDAIGRAHGGNAHRLAVPDAIVERGLADVERRRRRQIGAAGDDAAVGGADLEDHRVGVVVHQGLLCLHQHVEPRAVGAHAHVLRHVECRIEQRAVVGRRRDAQRDVVRQGAGAQHQSQQRRDQEQQQAAADARRGCRGIRHSAIPTGSRSRAPCECARCPIRSWRAVVTRRPRSCSAPGARDGRTGCAR